MRVNFESPYLHTELLRPIMYFDLNVPIPTTAQAPSQPLSEKAKGKQPQLATSSKIGWIDLLALYFLFGGPQDSSISSLCQG